MAARVGLADYDSNADFSTKTLKSLRQDNTPKVKLDNSVLSKLPSKQQVTSAIALYMPPNVSVSYKNSYESEPAEMMGTIGQALIGATTATSMQEKLTAVGQGVIGGLGDLGKKAIGEFGQMLGAGDPVKLTSKAFGMAINPHQEQFYVGPDFRSFSYTFDFWPRSQKELEAVNNIITLFKYHSHPDLDTTVTSGRMFFVPSEFEIHYLHMGKQNEYMNKISKCVCTSVDVNYGPEGEFKTFVEDGRGAAPIHYKLALSFTELEFMTKDKIYKGY